MSLKALDNALTLLTYFTDEKPAWGLREIAKEADTSHTIVHRIFSTFEQHGFLKQNIETGKYELGMKYMEYAAIVRKSMNISSLVLPVMKRICEETQETIVLTWLSGLQGICMEMVESPQSIKYATTVGSSVPLYGGAWGKVIMAYLSDEQQQEIISSGLQAFTELTMTSSEELWKSLEQIREEGWCYSVGEYTLGVVGIGAPLFDHENNIIASLTIAGPEYRIGEKEQIEFIRDKILEGCKEIQAAINRYQFLSANY